MTIAIGNLNPHVTSKVESRWRRIVTPIPVPESLPLLHRLRTAEPLSMAGMPPIVWREAEGFLVRDPYGNQWIDLTSGIVLANAGHSHPKIIAAIRNAIEERLLATYAFPHEPRLRLAEALVRLSPIPNSKAMLFSAGTEATEYMISLMRKRGRKLRPDKVGILSFRRNYHGRTLGAKLASDMGQDGIERNLEHNVQVALPEYGPIQEGSDEDLFDEVLSDLDQQGVDADRLAGAILEPAPGCITEPLPKPFAAALADWARRYEILLGFDEIQSGCGRAGTFFAGEQTGVTPDLIALGKGLTSSLPVSAVLGPAEIMDLAMPGEMSSTHSGNPVCAAAALANLQVIEEEQLVAASARTGTHVLERLRSLEAEFPHRLRAVRGAGLFISIHFRNNDGSPAIEFADDLALRAVRSGVLMFTTGRGYLKFTPPLSIDPDAADEAVDVLRSSLLEIEKGESS